MIYEYDFLDKNKLRQMLSLFDAGKFEDGAKSGPKDKKYKHNSQQSDIEIGKMVNTAVYKLIRESEISKIHILNKCSPSLMLKYEVGNHYADHSDFFEMWGTRTDYTCVVNLNDDYEGGEHYIQIGTERIEKKIEPGKALIYPTEFLHGVNPITSGVRKCLTFWMESSIVDPTIRYYLAELNKFYYKIEGSMDREDLVNFDLIRMGLIKRSSILRN